MASGKHAGKKRVLYLGAELDAALNAYVETRGEKLSEIVRSAIAAKIGRPDLAERVTMGRPRKDAAPDPAEPAPRKTARASGGKRVSAPKKSRKSK